MPSLDHAFLRQLKDNYTKYPTFIETGTLDGGTTFAMEPHFNKLYTIEYSEFYHKRTKETYTGNKIDFILGDSSVVLETLLPTIQTNAIFFLDGHWSGGNTGKSAKDCPLNEEITHIMKLFTHAAILVIDDYRLFGLRLSEDWTDINKDTLLSILGPRVKKVYHIDSQFAKDDRLIIHISKQKNPVRIFPFLFTP